MKLLKFPPPYKAWLTVSSDPDCCTPEAQEELNCFIWDELELPFSDSLFIRSYNRNQEGQLNLADHPEYFRHHVYDTIHTWGDYTHARTRGFDREDASEGLELLANHGIKPLVWTDHADFEGNILHRTTSPPRQFYSDASGHRQENFTYTLDLIHSLGIRYIWDGELTDYVGQDTEPSRFKWYSEKLKSPFKAAVCVFLDILMKKPASRFAGSLLNYGKEVNSLIALRHFGDGQCFYTFRRYGNWIHADIDGFADVITPVFLEKLMSNGGFSVIYTHLGKTRVGRHLRHAHIPDNTKECFRNLKQLYDDRKIFLSSLSDLLDYSVICRNVEIDAQERIVRFNSDGIRFSPLTAGDLRRFQFGLKLQGTDDIKVQLDGKVIGHGIERYNDTDCIVTVS